MNGIKIFISHQSQDSIQALKVKEHLQIRHGIECYLDVIDPNLRKGEEIADYIRTELDKCSHLLAVVSSATKNSWWVPWEIGVATEKDCPLATFGGNIELPEFLMKWPYLRQTADLDKYAEVVKQTYRAGKVGGLEHFSSRSSAKSSIDIKQFYHNLRSKLGQ